MKNSKLDLTVLQKYIYTTQMINAINLLKTQKTAEKLI